MDPRTTHVDAPRPLSRRTVLQGTAWTLPALVAVTAVPAAAASGVQDLEFYLTAGQVIGQGSGTGASGQFRSNGVRITSPDDRIIPAGVTIVFTLTYTGSGAVDFTNPQNGIDFNLGQNQQWTVDPIEQHRVVFTATSNISATEITIGSASWWVNQGVRPENESITFTGVATVPPGGGFPNGGTLTSLVVDPNGGTGALSGPDETTWPVA
ncbi:hypothetical protein WDU99_00650 [Microbacterium sp. Mu-80]|uniref:Uncharacterized protein n=1 Tax=Microbacterium bandirmense TaxID=3122050 RepID=A0ABU8L7Y7_9MICO